MKISKAKFERKLAELGAAYGSGVRGRIADLAKVVPPTVTMWRAKVNRGADFDPIVVGRIVKAFAELLREPFDLAMLVDESDFAAPLRSVHESRSPDTLASVDGSVRQPMAEEIVA